MRVSSFASEPAGVEHATPRLDHGVNHESGKTVGQQISELSEFEGTELLTGIGRGQHSGRLRSTARASREFVGAAHQEGPDRKKGGARHDGSR
jgi:hypothetical protein